MQPDHATCTIAFTKITYRCLLPVVKYEEPILYQTQTSHNNKNNLPLVRNQYFS